MSCIRRSDVACAIVGLARLWYIIVFTCCSFTPAALKSHDSKLHKTYDTSIVLLTSASVCEYLFCSFDFTGQVLNGYVRFAYQRRPRKLKGLKKKKNVYINRLDYWLNVFLKMSWLRVRDKNVPNCHSSTQNPFKSVNNIQDLLCVFKNWHVKYIL